MTGTPLQVQGSCHCGNVRLAALVEPERTGICHCTDCQNLTGTAYRVSVPAVDGSFRLTAGEPKVYVKRGDNGARRAQAFCGDCGSPLYAYDADAPAAIGLRVGCLLQRRELAPRRQKWCRSALPWSADLTGLPSRDRE